MKARAALLACLLFGTAAPAARAEVPGDELEAAERAYREVGFARVLELVARSLARGGHGVRETARLERLSALAHAALGNHARAYAAFVRLLAIEPERHFDQDLSPRIRAPYLEARGFWSSSFERLGAEVLAVTASRVEIRVSDPARMVRRVRVAFGRTSGPLGTITEQASSPRLDIDLPATLGADIRYELTLLDQHGNAVYATRGEMVTAATKPRRATLTVPQPERSKETLEPNRTPYTVTAAILAAAGAGVSGAGIYFHLERERQARSWNGPECERAGATRLEQCARVDDRRHQAEVLTIGLYAGGGALLAGSLFTLLAAPRKASRTVARSTPACTPLGAPFGLACSGRF